MTEEFKTNPHFYFFSPDETTSNKFDEVFSVEKRAWNLPTEPWDLPESPDGRIVEMLSENVLFSVMTGHLMNGETAMLGSYEAFLPVATSQILQQIKFIKQSKNVAWRKPIPAVNLLSTSTCWRQNHNGFTHQSPALISTLLDLPSNLTNCFFPIDDLDATEIYRFMQKSTNVVNLTTFNKTEQEQILSPTQAQNCLKNSVTVIDFPANRAPQYDLLAPKKLTTAPDFIFIAAGDLIAREVLTAVKLLQQDLPELNLRFVYIHALSYRAIGTTEQKLSQELFNQIFTTSCPIIANFHGYPDTLFSILSHYTASSRLYVHGFEDRGSTTTPFEMLRLNHTSRYDLVINAAKLKNQNLLVQKYQQIIEQNHTYAIENGIDRVV